MIKNKFKIGFLIIALFSFVGIGQASAANLTWSNNTTIGLTSPAVNLTIIGGSSVATGIVVDIGSITVTVDAGEVFTIQSADRTLVVSPSTGVAQTCTANVSQAVITGSVSPVAYTVSTTGPQCGAGSGGGSYTPSDTTIPAGSVLINAGATTTSLLSATLTLNATDAVGVAQMMISNDAGFAGASWENYVTSKNWTLTSGDGLKTVYVKFKDTAGNISATVSDTITASGTATVSAPVVSADGCSGGNLFNTSTGKPCTNNTGITSKRVYALGQVTLKNGSKGEAVKELQRFLNDKLSLGLKIDGKLGPKTIAVIKKWQKANGLVADGLIGAKTKAMMNK